MTTAWELAVTCPMMPSSGHVLNCTCWRPGWGLLGVSAVRIRTCNHFRLYNSVKMASIKEKAAALNLAEKLCVRPQGEPLVVPDRSVFVCVCLVPQYPYRQKLVAATFPLFCWTCSHWLNSLSLTFTVFWCCFLPAQYLTCLFVLQHMEWAWSPCARRACGTGSSRTWRPRWRWSLAACTSSLTATVSSARRLWMCWKSTWKVSKAWRVRLTKEPACILTSDKPALIWCFFSFMNKQLFVWTRRRECAEAKSGVCVPDTAGLSCVWGSGDQSVWQGQKAGCVSGQQEFPLQVRPPPTLRRTHGQVCQTVLHPQVRESVHAVASRARKKRTCEWHPEPFLPFSFRQVLTSDTHTLVEHSESAPSQNTKRLLIAFRHVYTLIQCIFSTENANPEM